MRSVTQDILAFVAVAAFVTVFGVCMAEIAVVLAPVAQ